MRFLNHLCFGPSSVFRGLFKGVLASAFFKFFSSANHGAQHFCSAPLPTPLKSFLRPCIHLSFLQEIITSKKDIRNILLLQTALLANDKYEVSKSKPVVGYDSRRGQACNFIKKEALAQVLFCEHLFHRAPLDDCFYDSLSMKYLQSKTATRGAL